jgi:D-3-phosphoglycerate dehydrogenase / 2-oxoglutarate reductase
MSRRLQVVNVDCNFTYTEEKRRIEAAGADLVLRKARTEAEIIAAGSQAAVVLLENADTPMTARVISALPELRAIIRYGVGIESVDQAEATSRGVVVANAADFCTEEVSDHAAALLLASVRRIAFFDRQLRAGGWQDFKLAPPLRRTKCLALGLIGWGRIAQAVARKMRGFHPRILVTDPFVQGLPPGSGVELVTLEQLLHEADLISIHVPLNPETRHLIGEKALQLIKPSAFLVNTSRGGVIDQAALVHALEEKRIGGAALDVFEEEPLPSSSALRKMEQVTLTPHYAASSQDSMSHLHGTVSDSVEAVLKGYWPPFPVNVKVQPRFPLRPWSEFRPGSEA